MSLSFTIMGCGSSGGVPRIGGEWGDCDPAEPRNRRRRCSVLAQRNGAEGVTRVVIDTSPDLREQALSADIGEIDGVWLTHEHADHTHGFDDLRAFYLRQRRKVPVWADGPTSAVLKRKFGYAFESADGSDYPPIATLHALHEGRPVMTSGSGGEITGVPFGLQHGNIVALGFRIEGVAYTPDLHDIPSSSIEYLENLDVWIIDALRRTKHPSHFSLEEALHWINRMKPRRAILTNLHIDLDYKTLRDELPKGVEPAYDGMQIGA